MSRRLDLGCESEGPRGGGSRKGFTPNRSRAQNKTPARGVGERRTLEHPVQPRGAPSPCGPSPRERNLGVGVRAKSMAQAAQLLAQLHVVVNLAVADDGRLAVGRSMGCQPAGDRSMMERRRWQGSPSPGPHPSGRPLEMGKSQVSGPRKRREGLASRSKQHPSSSGPPMAQGPRSWGSRQETRGPDRRR